MDPEFRMIAGRCILWFERRLAYPPEVLWEGLTCLENFNRWYPFPAAEIDRSVGGKIRFEEGELDATITELKANRVFAFNAPAGKMLARERDNPLRFELRPAPGDCLLRFTQIFDDRAAAAIYAAGWQVCLDSLEQALAGQARAPAALSPAEHDRLVRVFGLDLGFPEDTSDGWRVSFERQLMGPSIPEVWAELAPYPEPALAPGNPVPPTFAHPGLQRGRITAAQPPVLLEYDWLWQDRPRGRVRWELSQGPGGARIMLSQEGPPRLIAEQGAALDAWRSFIEALARRVQQAG